MWVSQRSALRPPPFSAPNSRSTPIFYRSLHSASAAFIFMLEFRMLSRNFARTWATRMQPSNLASEFLDGPLPRSIRRNSLSPVFTNVSALFLAPSAICRSPHLFSVSYGLFATKISPQTLQGISRIRTLFKKQGSTYPSKPALLFGTLGFEASKLGLRSAQSLQRTLTFRFQRRLQCKTV
jgi:hypothetical protein